MVATSTSVSDTQTHAFTTCLHYDPYTDRRLHASTEDPEHVGKGHDDYAGKIQEWRDLDRRIRNYSMPEYMFV